MAHTRSLPVSVLDLAPVPEGATTAQSLANTVDLAQAAERMGYTRFWLAEHHNMTGIASSATAVVVGAVAAKTRTIRIGAGGVMLPNHAPLMVAEAFGTLASLYGDRIDLGVGRAPGTDGFTLRALRRNPNAADTFPQDVVELLDYLDAPAAGQRVLAVPGTGTRVPVWVLGSSLFGAQLAAHLGLPYAFASHFAPAAVGEALSAYRELFQPSAYLDAPKVMLAANVFAADTDAEGAYLATSMMQAFVNLFSGNPGPLPRPVGDLRSVADPAALGAAARALTFSATGSPDSVRRQLAVMVERYKPDELILTGQIHDHEARKRSFEIAADVLSTPLPAAA